MDSRKVFTGVMGILIVAILITGLVKLVNFVVGDTPNGFQHTAKANVSVFNDSMMLIRDTIDKDETYLIKTDSVFLSRNVYFNYFDEDKSNFKFDTFYVYNVYTIRHIGYLGISGPDTYGTNVSNGKICLDLEMDDNLPNKYKLYVLYKNKSIIDTVSTHLR